MELYELIIEDENTDEVMALSLVEFPAIEAGWVYFSNQKEVHFATADEEKRTIVAPVLIPQKRIYRIDDKTGKEYEVFLTAETIEKLAQNYLKNGNQEKATYEHAQNIDGKVVVVESWVSKSSTKDKSANYFNRAFPIGTWFITMKVLDEKLWQDYVKTGKVKAISVEMLVGHKLVKAAAEEQLLDKDIEQLTDEEANVVLSKIRALIKRDSRYKSKRRIEMESYSDYPDSVKNAAKSALEWADKNGWGSCGTPVGKQRANQLSKGEPISVDTIKRMYSYVSRHEVDLETSKSFGDGCGYLMMQSWGGLGAGRWAKSKLSELGLLEEGEANPSITSTYPGEGPDKKKDYVHPADFK